MSNKALLTIATLTAAGVIAACTLPSSTANAAAGDDAAVRAAIKEINPNAKVDQILPGPIPALREVRSEGAVVYISADGRYLFQGDLYDVRSRTNLTDKARAQIHVGLLKQSPAKDHIRFGPKDATETLYVFTDISCGYCKEFHKQVPALNRMGIAVEYLAWPRSGPVGGIADEMTSVWCAKDRQAAYSKAIAGEPVAPANCAAPITAQYELGHRLEVSGTPAIYDSEGNQLGGYVTAAQVRQALAKRNSGNSGGSSRPAQ